MKKAILIFVVIASFVILSACQGPKMSSISFFEYMDTFIKIDFLAEKGEESIHKIAIEQIYQTYHELSTMHEPLNEDSTFLQNIYSINKKNDQVIEIDPQLFYLIEEAERIRVLTDGYFDISIGEAINIWKEMIFDESKDHLFGEVSADIIEQTIEKIADIETKENVITLSQNQGKYFIHVKSDTAQLDLGAIAKGYATQLVYDYLREQNIEYFSISAGTSSIAVGKNYNRDGGIFNVALSNPVREDGDSRTYGTIFVKNTGVTTAGNFTQYVVSQGLRYHHIISPKTKMPTQYYHTVTLIGENLGVLDAVSTALFSMSPDTFTEWFNENQEELNIEVIRFNYDLTITTYLEETVFEEKE